MDRRWLGTMTLAACLVGGWATRALADPVSISGVYSTQPFGAITSPQLTLTFPDFAVNIFDNDLPNPLALVPGFDVGNNSPVSFTQSTGSFSLHSTASGPTVEADVTGHISFSGPTVTVSVPNECPPFISCSQFFSEPITMSGTVTIQQGSHIFFRGFLKGSGTATASYSNFPPSQFWQGTDYTFTGLAETPEPASIVLLGSGVVWLARRRRGYVRAEC
jgi:hypothetical protein